MGLVFGSGASARRHKFIPWRYCCRLSSDLDCCAWIFSLRSLYLLMSLLADN
jgi:hypothetical protein